MRMAGSAVQSLFADMGSPDYSGLSNLGQKARAEEGIMAMQSDAKVDSAHMQGDAAMAKAKMQADVIGAQSSAQQQANMGSMIGSVGSMFGGLGTAGGAAPATTGFSGMSGVDVLKNPNIGYNVGTSATPAFRGNLFAGG